jgi:hypothetical protein
MAWVCFEEKLKNQFIAVRGERHWAKPTATGLAWPRSYPAEADASGLN